MKLAFITKIVNKIINMENPENYMNHTLNCSHSKQAHAFSKSERFKTQGSKDNYRFYDLPSMRAMRSSGFGYGQKKSIAEVSHSPPPGAYQSQSQFNKVSNKAFSFGKNRQEITFNSFFGDIKKAKRLPAPNLYRYKISTFSKRGGVIGNQLPNFLQNKNNKNNPGPGTYNLKALEMKQSGSYIISSFRNNSSPRYHHQRTKSVQDSIRLKKQFGGPGQYNNSEQIGKSLLSKFRNSVKSSFKKSARQSLEDKTKKNIPGSKYRNFSQFGTHI